MSRAGELRLIKKKRLAEFVLRELIYLSFIPAITENIDATIKYNVRNGSIGIYKHLPASVLFEWSENSIKIILEEIEKLKREAS